MLPERQVILLCQWQGDFSVEPELSRLDATGESTLNLEKFPEFELLRD